MGLLNILRIGWGAMMQVRELSSQGETYENLFRIMFYVFKYN